MLEAICVTLMPCWYIAVATAVVERCTESEPDADPDELFKVAP